MSIVSNMYIFVSCDDNCTIEINGARVNERIMHSNCPDNGYVSCVTVFAYYFIENVTQNDLVTIYCENWCGPGGLGISYIWNKCLYTLPRNGMEGIANIMNYEVTGNIGWSNMWENIPNLLPWMKNYIRMKDAAYCERYGPQQTFMTFKFKIGDAKNIKFSKKLWCCLGIDNIGEVFLNNRLVYVKSQPANIVVQFIVPNVNYGDKLSIDCQNTGGPGGISLTYVYQGMITGFSQSSLNGFGTVINSLIYTSSYGLTGTVYPAPLYLFSGNLVFNVNGNYPNWLNACWGTCNFGISLNIMGSVLPPPPLPNLNSVNFSSNEHFSNIFDEEEKNVKKIFIIIIIIIIIILLYYFLSNKKIKNK